MQEKCQVFDISRQGFQKLRSEEAKTEAETSKKAKAKASYDAKLMSWTLSQRSLHPRAGVKKLHLMLQKDVSMFDYKMGRDRYYDWMNEHNLVNKAKKRSIRTTDSTHSYPKYPNLLYERSFKGKNEIWVSDITYISTLNGFIYLALITDAVTKKIVGWNLSRSLETQGSIEALKMALAQRKDLSVELIHHTDRGCQYCSHEYVGILKANKILISMTEDGDSRANGLAERVNGIIKSEYLLGRIFASFEEAYLAIKEGIYLYCEKRLHQNLNYITPNEAHLENLLTTIYVYGWKKITPNEHQKETNSI